MGDREASRIWDRSSFIFEGNSNYRQNTSAKKGNLRQKCVKKKYIYFFFLKVKRKLPSLEEACAFLAKVSGDSSRLPHQKQRSTVPATDQRVTCRFKFGS